MKLNKIIISILLSSLILTACRATPRTRKPTVLAAESFLADICQNIAGERFVVDSLIPVGSDPHSFEVTPKDAVRIVEAAVLVINGSGFEEWLKPVLKNIDKKTALIEASAGLDFRKPKADEPVHEGDIPSGTGDPHFWLDPHLVIQYVDNIRAGLSQLDPAGATTYSQNAQRYIQLLKDLDAWIFEEVNTIPVERRLLVTNHESFGYFADRYGFKIIGAIIPNFSTNASPSAKDLALLSEHIRSTGVRAIFLETGSNPQIAEQLAKDSRVNVVTELYSHSITQSNGLAPTYIAMMRYNTRAIIDALK